MRYRRVNRLVKTDEFSSVFHFRRRITTGYLVVYAKPGAIALGRLGVTVSKKVARLAVTRNYAKRIVREVFRRNMALFTGLDVVVRVQKPFPAKAYALIEAELLGLMPALRARVTG